MEKLEKILSPMANYLNNNKVIQAISKGIMSTMAALMVGAAGSILLNLPIDAYQSFITSCGLNNVFNTLVNVTTNMLALYTAFTIAYAYTAQTKHDPLVAGLLSLLGFFIVTPMVTTGEGYAAVTNLPLSWLGAKGIFVSMFVAIITSLIFIKLSDKGLIIKMPEGVPEFVSKSFTGIIPGLVVGAVFSTLSFLAAQTSYGDVHNVVYTLIGQPLNGIGNSVWTGCLIYTLSGLCWFLGIHGIAVVSAIMPIWMAADAANLAATSAGQVAPNIITYQWINAVSSPGGAGATIGLVICILLFAKSKRYKTFGKVATIPSIVNINEPVVFGMPCMLNTLLFVPFVFLPVVFIFIAYFLTTAGILPVVSGIGAPSGTPLILSGFICGGWQMATFQICATIVSTLVYFPFFKILDKQACQEEQTEGNV